MDRRPITVAELIEARITFVGSCWIWDGYLLDGRPVIASSTGTVGVISLLWTQKNGPVPKGKVLICDHPRAGSDVCVNPDHYRPGLGNPGGPNVCRFGHDLSDEVNVWYSGGKRYCLLCMTRRKVGSPRPRPERK